MMDAWKIRGSKGTSRAAVATARSEKLRQAVMRICDDRQNMGGFPDHTFLFVRGMQKFSELEF